MAQEQSLVLGEQSTRENRMVWVPALPMPETWGAAAAAAKSRQLLLLSHVSQVRLFMTPWTVAYLAAPSMGFPRQEYWSGVPLPLQTLQETVVQIR